PRPAAGPYYAPSRAAPSRCAPRSASLITLVGQGSPFVSWSALFQVPSQKIAIRFIPLPARDGAGAPLLETTRPPGGNGQRQRRGRLSPAGSVSATARRRRP